MSYNFHPCYCKNFKWKKCSFESKHIFETRTGAEYSDGFTIKMMSQSNRENNHWLFFVHSICPVLVRRVANPGPATGLVSQHLNSDVMRVIYSSLFTIYGRQDADHSNFDLTSLHCSNSLSRHKLVRWHWRQRDYWLGVFYPHFVSCQAQDLANSTKHMRRLWFWPIRSITVKHNVKST